ncbi:type II toxin-antitoxin system RelE/ParE family toxin [Candidatus Acetothermia bacterium]|nr:type II toxin-antitoxin system RelE/ParE family toxin [Candidatus Acetothermia bacterium]
MAWTVEISPQAGKELLKFPFKHQEQITRIINRVAQDPTQAHLEALKEKRWAGCFRKRAGDYRVFMRLDPARKHLEVVSIRLRNEKTYR